MKLLVDGNILLDVLQNREPHVTASALVWKLCETGRAKGFVSALTFANLVYVLRRELDPEKTEEVLKKLSLIFSFAELSGADLLKAAGLHWNDYEDALQAVTAERLRVDFIITRNVKDFKQSKVLALTPAELLARL
jgi:predicted nucleic acid-binding protein